MQYKKQVEWNKIGFSYVLRTRENITDVKSRKKCRFLALLLLNLLNILSTCFLDWLYLWNEIFFSLNSYLFAFWSGCTIFILIVSEMQIHSAFQQHPQSNEDQTKTRATFAYKTRQLTNGRAHLSALLFQLVFHRLQSTCTQLSTTTILSRFP